MGLRRIVLGEMGRVNRERARREASRLGQGEAVAHAPGREALAHGDRAFLSRQARRTRARSDRGCGHHCVAGDRRCRRHPRRSARGYRSNGRRQGRDHSGPRLKPITAAARRGPCSGAVGQVSARARLYARQRAGRWRSGSPVDRKTRCLCGYSCVGDRRTPRVGAVGWWCCAGQCSFAAFRTP